MKAETTALVRLKADETEVYLKPQSPRDKAMAQKTAQRVIFCRESKRFYTKDKIWSAQLSDARLYAPKSANVAIGIIGGKRGRQRGVAVESLTIDQANKAVAPAAPAAPAAKVGFDLVRISFDAWANCRREEAHARSSFLLAQAATQEAEAELAIKMKGMEMGLR